MNNKTNWATPNGSDFRGAQAAATQQPHAEQLELFAEELPVQRDLLGISSVSTGGTLSSIGGCAGSLSSVSSIAPF